jgi:hypothetical protein
MSQENAEMLRRGYEAFSQGDMSAVTMREVGNRG